MKRVNKNYVGNRKCERVLRMNDHMIHHTSPSDVDLKSDFFSCDCHSDWQARNNSISLQFVTNSGELVGVK